MVLDGPEWGQEDFFPTNPDLADILDRTDFDFENLYFFDLFGVPNFWLGPTWAHFGRNDTSKSRSARKDRCLMARVRQAIVPRGC